MNFFFLEVLFLFCVVSTFSEQESDDFVEMLIDSDAVQRFRTDQYDDIPQENLQAVLKTPQDYAIGIKIKNPRNEIIDYYWDDGVERVYQGFIKPYGVTATTSYVGHIFRFTKHQKPNTVFHSIQISPQTNLYILPPDDVNNKHYKAFLEEQKFCDDYQKRTGIPWLAHYPRNPPVLHMWPAEYIGQKHYVASNETYWKCIPKSKNPSKKQIKKCRSKKPLNITIEVLSLKPKIFRINNTLSDAEADFVVSYSKPKIKRSLAGTDGGLVSNTRTSSNTWLARKEHYILDTIYRRAAHILNIDENLFHPGAENNVVEDLQVVNYKIGQEYTPHHDFGADGHAEQRYITLLYYLNDLSSEDGGETGFPKANNGAGFKIHPGKGNSVLFYSLLEDGNADELTLHAGTPVKRGEKWICNFWVWDPKRF